MTAVRLHLGRLILGGALIYSAPFFVQAQAAVPPVPGAPVSPMSSGAAEGLHLSINGVELEPITAEEIAGGSTLSQSGASIRAHASGSGLRADIGLQVTPVVPVVRRELRDVWQYSRRVEQSKGGGSPRVRVELEGPGGRGSLVSLEDGVSRLPVRLHTSRTSRRPGGDGLEVFEGGIVLDIPVEVLDRPGRYRGQLRITVEEL